MAKSFILDVWQGFEYTSDFSTIKCLRYGLCKKEVVCLFIAFVEKSTVSIYTAEMLAICKSRHWILGIGIGIGNGTGIGADITNTIISISIRPMDPKLSRMVTQDERNQSTESRDTSILWSRDK